MTDDKNSYYVQKLCSLLNQQQKAELQLSRARYQVSYYNKIRDAICQPKGVTTRLPDGYFKWKNDPKGLDRKIEDARLKALEVQRSGLELRSRLQMSVNLLLRSTNSVLKFENGMLLGLRVGNRKDGLFIPTVKFTEYANEYEATFAMNQVLEGSET